MKNRMPYLLGIAVSAFLSSVSAALPDSRPNILLIVADDLAYSDLGVFGSEISTPALDALAAEGATFTNFYVLPTCSPTRSALMSGNTSHAAGMGVMSEWIYPAIEGRPGYEGYLSDQVVALPEALRAAGYNTYMSGKWHLGETDDRSPFRRGFDRTFAMMQGGGSHFADMRPLTLDAPMTYRRNGERLDRLPEDFYSTRNYTDELIGFIEQDLEDGKPFFAYLSYTAPHDPLHAPADYIARYDGRYDAGWDALHAERIAAMQAIGLVPADIAVPENFLAPAWADVPEEHRTLFSRDMAVYAAMVDYLDTSVGRLFEYLRSAGEYDNTLIVFMSDNGANGAHATAYPGNLDGEYLRSFDNSLENRGRPGSFIEIGPGWARAVSGPFRYFKTFTSEGGIRSPMILRLPDGGLPAGSRVGALAHVSDLMPTFLELAEAEYPDTFNGRAVVPPIGRSLLPLLDGRADDMNWDRSLGFELFEMRALIQGSWKLSRMTEPFGTGAWELYDLAIDPGETRDQADRNPERVDQMLEAWQEFVQQNGVFDHAGYFDAIFRRAYGVD